VGEGRPGLSPTGDRLAPGSYVLITHFSDSSPEARANEKILQQALGRGKIRSIFPASSWSAGSAESYKSVLWEPAISGQSAYADLYGRLR